MNEEIQGRIRREPLEPRHRFDAGEFSAALAVDNRVDPDERRQHAREAVLWYLSATRIVATAERPSLEDRELGGWSAFRAALVLRSLDAGVEVFDAIGAGIVVCPWLEELPWLAGEVLYLAGDLVPALVWACAAAHARLSYTRRTVPRHPDCDPARLVAVIESAMAAS